MCFHCLDTQSNETNTVIAKGEHSLYNLRVSSNWTDSKPPKLREVNMAIDCQHRSYARLG